MQFRSKRLALTGFVLTGVLAVGCASGSNRGLSDAQHAVECPKCETKWVTQSTPQGNKVTLTKRTGKMVCPECDAMAQSVLLGDDKVQLHNCPTCLVTPTLTGDRIRLDAAR